MKIPESIRIGGVEYSVSDVPNLNDGGKVLYGEILFGKAEIHLNSANQNHEIKCVTLLHEIIHGIADQASLELGNNEERIIDTFAFGIYQVLQDNGRRLFDIVPAEAVSDAEDKGAG